MPDPITTLSFFRYEKPASRWWAFRQMGLAPALLTNTPGLRFSKMLGSGSGNGFSIWPDFGAYALLGVWGCEADACRFFDESPLFAAFRQRSSHWWTAYLWAVQSHGRWGGIAPFPIVRTLDEAKPVGVITRATIAPKHLWRFWRFVPSVSRAVEGRAGLLFSLGIGELPVVQQATFSLWENSSYMKAYAYESPNHREVIRRTRRLGWYKEELFARFHPYRAEGEWVGGGTPLDAVLAP
ncbi:MAG: hypothetical protein KDC66_02280 [Phaeodactylibacter sp.]|nr:hypothetical protein [Phaeodactylibacter sp.]MCB9272622.1 hypothetical protein [Lewinellaceae bacterium]